MHHPYALPRRATSKLPEKVRPTAVHRHSSAPAVRAPETKADTGSVARHTVITGPQSSKHFVKQDGPISLVLAGHSGGLQAPIYASGSIIRGLVTLAKVQGLVSIEVKLQGCLKVMETAGGGFGKSILVSESLYMWEKTEHSSTAPSEFNFSCQMPSFYPDPEGGSPRPLPPSYDARLSAIPGFRVCVQYEVVVSLTRVRELPTFWRNRVRLRVPFIYKFLTRPKTRGPFPRNSEPKVKWPQTVFSGAIRPRLSSIPSIRFQAYLSSSRVTPLNKTIPFTVSLLADGEILLPFRSSTTSLTSFHPLSQTHSASSFVSRLAPNSRPPLKVHLERHTFTKARATGVLVFGTSENGISSSEILAEGSVYHTDQREGSVSWSGELMIPESVECGGFRTERLKVEDILVFTIRLAAMETHVLPFRMDVPIQLTTDSATSKTAVKVSEPS